MRVNVAVKWLVTILGVLAAFVLLSWAVQTGWLGSFPGRDKDLYTKWMLLQLAGCVVAIACVVLVWVFPWLKRRRR